MTFIVLHKTNSSSCVKNEKKLQIQLNTAYVHISPNVPIDAQNAFKMLLLTIWQEINLKHIAH